MTKKLIFVVLVVGLAMLLLPATAALADNGPHGNFSATNPSTAGCAACHRAHTAKGAYLLKDADVYDLCTSCHGSSGNGANTDVLDGIYTSRRSPAPSTSYPGGLEGIDGGALLAGGFDNTIMNTSYSTTAVASRPTTSSHKVDGATKGTVWGWDGINSGPGYKGTDGTGVALECTDCHNPHGMSASVATNGSTATYRILRSAPIGVPYTTVPANVPDQVSQVNAPAGQTGKWYTVGHDPATNGNKSRDPDNATTLYPNDYFYQPYTGAKLDNPSVSGGVVAGNTMQQISLFCAQCHTRHSAPSGSWQTNSGDSIYAFRHTGNGTERNCIVCHTSHGSSAQMVNGTSMVYYPGTIDPQTGVGTPEASSLLRLDNRGVCAGCHARNWGKPAAITSMSPTSGSLAAIVAGTLTVTINGNGFGVPVAPATTGGTVTFDGVAVPAGNITTWTDTQIVLKPAAGGPAPAAALVSGTTVAVTVTNSATRSVSNSVGFSVLP